MAKAASESKRRAARSLAATRPARAAGGKAASPASCKSCSKPAKPETPKGQRGAKSTANQASNAAHAREVGRRLKQMYPDAHCALNFRSPLELLVATILSAQCTDQRVNMVTESLFRKYRSAADYAAAPADELKRDIQSTGFFNNKAKSIQASCQMLVDRYRGDVPRDLDALVALPGIGRKTANVVLGTAFGIPTGVVVDTHVARISQRLGLTRNTQAEKIEQDLMALLPTADWIDFSHRVIDHGRKICAARKPKCDDCRLRELCPQIGVAAK